MATFKALEYFFNYDDGVYPVVNKWSPSKSFGPIFVEFRRIAALQNGFWKICFLRNDTHKIDILSIWVRSITVTAAADGAHLRLE